MFSTLEHVAFCVNGNSSRGPLYSERRQCAVVFKAVGFHMWVRTRDLTSIGGGGELPGIAVLFLVLLADFSISWKKLLALLLGGGWGVGRVEDVSLHSGYFLI